MKTETDNLKTKEDWDEDAHLKSLYAECLDGKDRRRARRAYERAQKKKRKTL